MADENFEPSTVAEQRIAAMKAFRDSHKGETITPRMLIDEVKAGMWPQLFDFFDWDDASAAESHRLEQAKVLLRIKVTLTVSPTSTVRVPVMVSDPRKGGGGYLSTVEVVSNVELSRMSMMAELMQIRRALFRSQQIAMATRFANTIGEWLTEKLVEIDAEIGGLEDGGTAPAPVPPPQAPPARGRRRAA